MKLYLCLFCLLLLNISWSSCSKDEDEIPYNYDCINAVTVFSSGEDGYATFRIPTIIIDDVGVIYAFAEGRVDNSSDWGNVDIVMKKSTDGGLSWGNIKVVKDIGRNKCGNACPLYDKINNRIVMVWKYGKQGVTETTCRQNKSHEGLKLCCTYSTDGGETWTNDANITKLIPDSVGFFSVGPVHGLQLTNNERNGRIIIPAYGILNDHYRSFTIYSDNGGKTWHTSNIITDGNSGECVVTELKNGELMLSQRYTTYRNRDKIRPYRLGSKSYDGGVSWTETQKVELVDSKGCQASLITIRKDNNLTDTLLFSNPFDEEIRQNLTIHFSTDSGQTWDTLVTVYSGPSGYSDLVQLNDNEIGVLYEGGVFSYHESIKFARFSIHDMN